MELITKPKNNHVVEDDFLASLTAIDTSVDIADVIHEDKQKHFIEANTDEVTLQYLKSSCTIPVFSKDNETTIPHQQFIEVVKDTAQQFFYKSENRYRRYSCFSCRKRKNTNSDWKACKRVVRA